jgi:hypothetical protein
MPGKQVCTRTKVYVIWYLAPGAFQALFLCPRVCRCLTSARDSEMVSRDYDAAEAVPVLFFMSSVTTQLGNT